MLPASRNHANKNMSHKNNDFMRFSAIKNIENISETLFKYQLGGGKATSTKRIEPQQGCTVKICRPSSV